MANSCQIKLMTDDDKLHANYAITNFIHMHIFSMNDQNQF